MIDRDALEKALLFGVVKQQNWNVLILNGITKEFFTPVNKLIYEYILNYIQKNTYPQLPLIAHDFDIDDDSMASYLQISDLNGLCDSLRRDYLKEVIKFKVNTLNDYQNEYETDPNSYIQRIGNVYNDLRVIGYQNKSRDILENIDGVRPLDPTNTISTGFDELDEALVGWKRGEELVVFSARPGQGKSFMGLKFALNAALKGERVGIYSGEMSLESVQERLLYLAKPTYTSTLNESMEFLKKNNIFIRVLTQKELRRYANVNDIEEMIIRDNLTMVVVDQLSLMEDVIPRSGVPLRQVYGNISRDLMGLSSKYDLPIILLVQTNRQGAQEQVGPALENIAESDTVGQNATRVITMRNENNLMAMKLVKNRYGSPGMTIKYEVDFSINKFKYIRDIDQVASNIKRAKARQLFGEGGPTF